MSGNNPSILQPMLVTSVKEPPREVTVVTNTCEFSVREFREFQIERKSHPIPVQRYKCDKCQCIVIQTKGALVKHKCTAQVSKNSL